MQVGNSSHATAQSSTVGLVTVPNSFLPLHPRCSYPTKYVEGGGDSQKPVEPQVLEQQSELSRQIKPVLSHSGASSNQVKFITSDEEVDLKVNCCSPCTSVSMSKAASSYSPYVFQG